MNRCRFAIPLITDPMTIAVAVFLSLAFAFRCQADSPPRREAIDKALRQQVITPETTRSETQILVDRSVPPMPATFDSPAAWQAEADRMRQQVLDRVVLRGEAQAWSTAKLRVEWLDAIEGLPGYRIRKLRYEALPGLWIPALLYEPTDLAPAESGKPVSDLRAVALNVNGHDPNGKAADYKQIRCINLAKRGMLALNVEWLGMGQLRGADYSHAAMNQIDLCGTSGLAPFYLAMKRGIDLLLEHPHADPKRVAVAGLSGGGWQTITISSLDTRVTLSNPVAGYSSFLTRNRHAKDLGDSEQTPTDLATIADYTHLTAMMAPRATLLTYNTMDNCCFEAGYALPPLVEAAKPIFSLLGRPDALRTHQNEEPGDHNFGLDNRQALYRMIGDHFFPGDTKYVREEIASEAEVQTADKLDVPLPKGNASIHSLAVELAKSLPRVGQLPDPKGGLVPWQASHREKLRQILRWQPLAKIDPQRQPSQSADGITITPMQIRLDDTWTVAAIEFAPASPRTTSLLIADAGMAETGGEVARLVANGHRVITLDPFYFGQSKFPSHDYLQALLVATIGQRALGIQASQVAAIASFAKRQYGAAPAVIADGWRTSLIALAAAAADADSISAVTLQKSRASLREVIEKNEVVTAAPEAFCFGLLEHFDTPQLAALVAPRPLAFAAATPRHRESLGELRSFFDAAGGTLSIEAVDLAFEGESIDQWNGFTRHRFRFDGADAWVVEPKRPRGDGSFSWCLMFPDAFTQRCAAPALLEAGFYHVFLDVGNTFGSPEAVSKLAAFHESLIARGLASRAVLIGISRGGLYAHRYAAQHPDRVAVIYGDAPVLDFKSWPGGRGKGKGSPGDWETLKRLYRFPDDAAAVAFEGNPIDTLAMLADHKIALIYVAGDADDVVPFDENALVAQQRFEKLGGRVVVIRKPGVGHHPHGLDDPAPVVEFIRQQIDP